MKNIERKNMIINSDKWLEIEPFIALDTINMKNIFIEEGEFYTILNSEYIENINKNNVHEFNIDKFKGKKIVLIDWIENYFLGKGFKCPEVLENEKIRFYVNYYYGRIDKFEQDPYEEGEKYIEININDCLKYENGKHYIKYDLYFYFLRVM